MSGDHDIPGELCPFDDEPDWQPLLDVVGVELAHWFMWMGGIKLEDGGYVHPYKHRATRRYLHLAQDGRAFAYVPRRPLSRDTSARGHRFGVRDVGGGGSHA